MTKQLDLVIALVFFAAVSSTSSFTPIHPIRKQTHLRISSVRSRKTCNQSTNRNRLEILSLSSSSSSSLPASSSSSRKRRPQLYSESEEQISNHATVLHDLSKQGTKETANIAYDILQSLESSASLSPTTTQAFNVVHYALVINAFANIGHVSSAENILNKMIEKFTNSMTEEKEDGVSASASDIIMPNAHCFSGVIKAYTKEHVMNKNKNGKTMHEKNKAPPSSLSLVTNCEDIVQQMSKLYKMTGREHVKPNAVVYNSLLKAYAHEAAFYTSQQGGSGGVNSLPTTFHSKRNMSYNNNNNNSNIDKHDDKIKALVDKTIDILSKMETGYIDEDKDGNNDIKYPEPDSYSYCTIISILARCVTDVKAAKLAESYLEKLTPFDTASYNAVLLAWSKIATSYGAERATLLLEQLESSNISSSNLCDRGPNSTSYNTVISAWVKSCSYGDDGFAAKKAEEILRRMEQNERFKPNVIAYSSIIDCWSRSGSLYGAKRAQKLLDHMEHLYLSGINKYVKPNVISYTSVLTAYARTNTLEGANRAHDLLKHMKKLQTENENDVKPNVVSYFAVIDSWARSNSDEAGVNAESTLIELEKLYAAGDKSMRPDVRVYARVISAHVKCGNTTNYESAEKIVKRMERFFQTGDEGHALAKPNVVIYNTLINAYARQRNVKRALKVLNQMDRYNSKTQQEEDKVRADENTLNGIIYALSVGYGKGKARKSLKMLERLENSHINGAWDVKPSTRSYNMVINACANSFKGDEKERSEALSIALNVYSKLIASSYADVDRFTFISLLKACGKLMRTKSKKRQQYVADIFNSCCNEGLVDDDILGNYLLAASSSSEVPKSILSYIDKGDNSTIKASMLPSEWTFRAKKSSPHKNSRRKP